MWEFIFVSSCILAIGLFFVIFQHTKAGERFFSETEN